MNFLRRLFGKKSTNSWDRQSPKRPRNWNLTLDDLDREVAEGKRPHLSGPEIHWAIEYERSLFPKGMRIPQQGDLYEALEDQTVDYLTSWSAPVTLGGKATLFKGEQVWIDEDPQEKAISTYARLVEYKKLEERMVPESDRKNPKYSNFYLSIKFVVLNEKFKLVQTDYKQ